MAEEIEVDEFGIPIKGQATVQVDEFGIPLKKKDDITVSPEQPTKDSATVSGQQSGSGGEVEVNTPIDLPKTYERTEPSTYKNLISGKKYKLTQGGKPIIGTWDESTQSFIKEPLINALPQVKQTVGFVEALEVGLTLKPPVETKEEAFGRAATESDNVYKEVKQKVKENDDLMIYPAVQRYAQLQDLYSKTDDDKVKSKIKAEIERIKSANVADEGILGAQISTSETPVYTDAYIPQLPPYKELTATNEKLPKINKTVGEAYNQIVSNIDFIQQGTKEVSEFESSLNNYLISKLPQDKQNELKRITDEAEYNSKLQEALVESKQEENVIAALFSGLSHKMSALADVGSNLGLDDITLAKKKVADIKTKELFAKQPKGTTAEIFSSIGGMLPDIFAGTISPPLMMGSMMSTMPNDFLEQSIADDYYNGRPIDIGKAKQYAGVSTVLQGGMLIGAGKIGSHGLRLLGDSGKKRVGELLYEIGKRGTKDAVIFGALGTKLQNELNKAYDLSENDEYLNAMVHMFAIGGLFAAKEGLPQLNLTSKQKSEIDYISSYLPADYTRKQVKQLIEKGLVTPTRGEEISKKLDDYRTIVNEIPSSSLPYQQMEKIYPSWLQKQELQKKLVGATPEIKNVLSGQISELDRKILIDAAIPLTAEENLELKKLTSDEAQAKSIDKTRKKYLEQRKDAADKVAEEKLQAEEKSKEEAEKKEEETIKRQQEEKAAEEQVVEQPEVVAEQAVVETPAETVSETEKYQRIKTELPKSEYATEDDFKSDLQDGIWAILTAENPNDTRLSEAENAQRNKQAEQWLVKKGYKPQRVAGKYNRAENSFYVKGMTKADAIAFANLFGQENVATDKGLYYQDGSYEARIRGGETYGAADNYVSAINVGGKPVEFSVEYSRNKTIPTKNEKQVSGNRLFSKPLEVAKTIADRYAEKLGFKRSGFEKITKANFDKERAKRIAKAFDDMQNNPNDQEVKAAYEAMAKETIDQYKEIMKDGYSVEVNNDEPYSSSEEMIEDLRDNKRMKIFSTESGFGDEAITEQQRKENPLLRDSGFKDANGVPLLVNDIFRFVHDFFGHSELGNSFGELGEENAWNVHARMYSPLARRAMTTETRGQNSWVNSSGINKEAFEIRDKARKLREVGEDEAADVLVKEVYDRMKFAEQKVGLLPEEFSKTDDELLGKKEPAKDTQTGIKAEPTAEVIPEGVQLFESALTERTEKKRDKALNSFGDKEADARRLIEDYDTNIEKLKAQGIEPTGTKAEVLADMLSGKYDEVLQQEAQPAEQVNIERRPTTMPDGDEGVELFAISQDGTEKSIGKFYADDTTEIEKAERNYRWGQEQKAKRPQQATEAEVEQPTGDKVGKTVSFEHAGGRVSGVVVAVDEKGNLKVEGVGTNKGTKFTVKPTELYGEVTEQMVEAETKNKELEEKIKTRLGKKKEPPKGDKLTKSVIGSQQLADIPNRLVQNWLSEKVRGLENYVAKTVQRASVSDNVIKRNIADFITSLSRGIMDTQEYSQAKRQKLTGEIGKAKLDVEDFHADLWDLIGGDINSADRVHQVLDPEVSGTGLKYGDLTDAEKDLHDLLRDLNDYTHNQNFLLGKISQETYDKYKDKYIGRDYVFDDKPDQTIGGRSIKEVLGIYKQRKDLDQAMKDAAVKDPIYLTLKRYLQTAQNKAIADYSDWIFQNHGENNVLGNAVFVSDTPKDGFIKLGKGYGALSNKYVARNVAEDFGSFVFNNEFMSLAYDAFKAYDGLPPRQFMKELLTVGNPQVQLGNATSNIVFSWLGGVDFPTYISKSLEARRQIKERGDVYRFLTDEGLLGSDFISKDLKPMETVIGGEPTTTFGKARKKLRSVYSGVDDAAKIQMFLSLKDMGYTDQQAVTIVFESMQNYQNTGRIWDFASKTPIIGNSFVKFTPEMLRLLKNGMTRRPLHTLAFVSMLSTLPSIIGKNMGDDDEEIDAAAKMKGIPKITIPYTDLNIPLSWRIGDKRVNLARFLMPMYIYDIGGESRKATEFVNKFMPYQLKETETGGLTPFNVQDPFVAPIISILQNKDFRDKPIVEETDNSFDATLKRLRYATRGYGGFYANMIDDIFSTAVTGEDFYGRRKTALDVALNTLIKVETFDDERLKQGVIREFDGYERMTDKLYRAYTTKRKKIDGEVKEIKKDKTLSEERKKELIAMKQQDLMRVSSNVLEEVADVQKEMIEATEFYRNLSRKQKYSEISGAMSQAERTIKNRMRKIDGKFVKQFSQVHIF